MENKTGHTQPLATETLPFPADWIHSHPRRVEEFLSQMSVADQILCAVQLRGKNMQEFISLSPQAEAVVRGLPPEEVYQMIKETGLEDALPVLSLMTENQLQYGFDLEWWHGDRFVPERAREWIELLDQCEASHFLEWFQTEDFDQKVVLLQALIKVYKNDEMTDSYEGVENLSHFSPDGVYDIFFKTKTNAPVKKLLMLIRSVDPALFSSLMEAVIWYPVTQTVEKAYRGRLIRTSERGIPEFEEAMEIYSPLKPESLKVSVPEVEDFAYPEEFNVAPKFPLTQAGSVPFFKDSFSLLQNPERLHTLCWELVYLANKVMVADGADPSRLEVREQALRKGLGYVNIGLELGASSDPNRGAALLGRTRLQPLFQVGYQQLRTLKWKAEHFIRQHGTILDAILGDIHKQQLAALVVRFPTLGQVEGGSLAWRNFASIQDVRWADSFLDRWMFHLRFAQQALDLNEETLKRHLDDCGIPENREDGDLYLWTITAFARYVLFQEISCEPLPEPAAKSFLEMAFLPGAFKEEEKVCDDSLIEAFHRELLKAPLAWVESDRKFLADLMQACREHLQSQFGRVDPKEKIEWRFTRGLCIKSSRSGVTPGGS